MRVTRTYALLEISAAAYDEIAVKLRDAGYEHAFGSDGEIDMHGIAVTREAQVAAGGNGASLEDQQREERRLAARSMLTASQHLRRAHRLARETELAAAPTAGRS